MNLELSCERFVLKKFVELLNVLLMVVLLMWKLLLVVL